MTYFDIQQSSPWFGQQHHAWYNQPQALQGMFNPFGGAQFPSTQAMPGLGVGQAAYGQVHGQPQFGYGQMSGWGLPQAAWGQPGWGQLQARQLSPQDVGEVVRQLLPILPHIVAQAQQPQIGYAAYGQPQRQLSPQDVNEIVRQLLPVVPQILGLLQQGQPQPQHAAMAAMYGGFGPSQLGQSGFAPGLAGQQPFGFGQNPLQQQLFGQSAWPYAQAAYAPQGAQGYGLTAWGQPQRQLTQQDAAEVARQLVGLIPQVIGNLQNFHQQRVI
jgi:hypothetical protein